MKKLTITLNGPSGTLDKKQLQMFDDEMMDEISENIWHTLRTTNWCLTPGDKIEISNLTQSEPIEKRRDKK